MARAIVIHIDEPTLREVTRVRHEGEVRMLRKRGDIEEAKLFLRRHKETCKKKDCFIHQVDEAFIEASYDFEGHERFARVLRQIEAGFAAAAPASERKPVTTDY